MPKIARQNLRGVAQLIHATPDVSPDLLLGPGDAPDRTGYFDVQTSDSTGPLVAASRARLTDYVDIRGRRTHRRTLTIPPSTALRIAIACGEDDPHGSGSKLNAALIGLAEWAIDELRRQGKQLRLTTPDDPRRAERMAVRKKVSGRG